MLAVRGRDRDWKHRGQTIADRTSTAALTAGFSGTLIGPLMSLEEVVKARKMESVPLRWPSIIWLCALFVNHNLFLFPILLLCFCAYSLSFTLSPFSQSLYPFFGMLFCCPFASLTLHQSFRFSPSPTLIAMLKWQQLVIVAVCVFIIYLPFMSLMCVFTSRLCKGCVVLTSQDPCVCVENPCCLCWSNGATRVSSANVRSCLELCPSFEMMMIMDSVLSLK